MTTINDVITKNSIEAKQSAMYKFHHVIPPYQGEKTFFYTKDGITSRLCGFIINLHSNSFWYAFSVFANEKAGLEKGALRTLSTYTMNAQDTVVF